MIRQNRYRVFMILTCISFSIINSPISKGWGFFAHKLINRHAVFSLPTPLFNFYKYYIYTITLNAINADKRRGVIEGESARHFIDLDYYNIEGNYIVPYKWEEAIEKFSENGLKQHGTAPWNLLRMRYRLTAAFKSMDLEQIIKLSSDIGHYAADINVPLHTTKNYNGQLTNQHGIHAFWESRLPELFANTYYLFVGTASYINNFEQRVWSSIALSHLLVNKVIADEAYLSSIFPIAQKYSFEQRGSTLQKVYSLEYSQAYHDMMEGMVEKQLCASIKLVADIWYTCWVDAGSPNMDFFYADMDKLDEKYKDGKNERSNVQKLERFIECE